MFFMRVSDELLGIYNKIVTKSAIIFKTDLIMNQYEMKNILKRK